MTDRQPQVKKVKSVPIALVRQDTPDKIVAYACGVCHAVVPMGHPRDGKTAEEIARKLAEEHCPPWICNQCGAEHYRAYQSLCLVCYAPVQAQRDAEQEKARFDKARKVPLTEYEGPLFIPQKRGSADVFLPSAAELLDWFADEELPLPEYVWACTVLRVETDADSIIQNMLEEHWEGAEVDYEEELYAFIEQWNAKQTGRTWEPDYHTAVLLHANDTEGKKGSNPCP